MAEIETLYSHEEDIQFNMFENVDDPTLLGYDASAYVLLEKETLKFKNKISTLTQVDRQQRSGEYFATQVNLPNITIPKFNQKAGFATYAKDVVS